MRRSVTFTAALTICFASPAFAKGGHGGGGGGGHGGGGHSGGGSHASGGSHSSGSHSSGTGSHASSHGGHGGGTVRDHRHGGGTGGRGIWWPYGYYSVGIGVGVPIYGCLEDPNEPTVTCPDERVIVGHPRGQPYGAWATTMRLPHTIVDAGFDVRRFADPIAGKTISSPSGTHTVVGMAGPDDRAAAAVFRVGFGGSFMYGAGELEIGSLTTQPSVVAMTPDARAQSVSQAMVFGYGGVFGIAQRLGAARVGVEGIAGGRTLSYSFGTTDASFSATATVPVVEARVRGELWLTPWIAAGAMVGSSVIARNDWVAGLYLSMHTRAYGGQP